MRDEEEREVEEEDEEEGEEFGEKDERTLPLERNESKEWFFLAFVLS